MTHVILARVIKGLGVELKVIALEAPAEMIAQVASNEGYDLMYEMDREPDMAKATQLALENRLVALDGVVQLWDLQNAQV